MKLECNGNALSCRCSASDAYYWCVMSINCTGQNVSDDLLYAQGVAEANKYLCSKELRPSQNTVYVISTLLSIYLFFVENVHSLHVKFT